MFALYIILGILGGLMVLLILELFIVGFILPSSLFSISVHPFSRSVKPRTEASASCDNSREVVRFEVSGTMIHAWLYLPKGLPNPPCIVMAHGLGGTKAAGLDPYARRFQLAGFAVLAFDYRHIGESGGEPRQLIWIPKQLEDYAAAVQFARGLKHINPDRIALWGTSLSGGHAIMTASKDHRVACVSVQCPMLDGDAGARAVVKKYGIKGLLKVVPHAQRDLVRSWLGLSAHTIPLFGKIGTISVISDNEGWEYWGAPHL